jgi:AAA15 family ATPase/GTPase
MLVARYWRDCVVTNVDEKGYRRHHPLLHDHLANHAIEFFYENPALKEQVELLLSKYDLGFGAFVKHKNELQERTFFGIEHKFDSGKFELPLEYESSGTKQAIIILRYILTALSEGGIAVIDEIDANLHPELVEEMISMFSSKELNPRSAQIIFSSHTPTILATLDKYQITFVEKNDSGQSEVWRLDSIRGVRPDENYYAKYIAGAYGAIPEIG